MIICEYCREELLDGTKYCPNCGAKVEEVIFDYKDNEGIKDSVIGSENKASTLSTIAFIIMIIKTVSSVFTGFGIIALFWRVPMIVKYRKESKEHIMMSTGFKVCILLFISVAAGIIALCDYENYQ